MIRLQWAVADGNQWYTLEGYNFSRITAKGVYAIWHEGQPGRYVRVGQGIIGEQLTALKHDAAILSYRRNGILRVTWAVVQGSYLQPVERYLTQTLQPLVSHRLLDIDPIRVNLPGAA
jgi:hypothetical protein